MTAEIGAQATGQVSEEARAQPTGETPEPQAGESVVRLVDLRDAPLDVAEVLAALEDDGGGGLALFVGRVRDTDQARRVRALEYSAHPSALAGLERVCRRVAQEHAVLGIAAVHRVGRLEVGDIAVVSAAVATHRGEAFAASRALIDSLKAEVPIWKHQVFADGTDEWVGSP